MLRLNFFTATITTEVDYLQNKHQEIFKLTYTCINGH